MSAPCDDLAVMEDSLVALGDGADGLATELFERFIADHPHYAHAFVNPQAARERMTRETLEALLGLAAGEWWVTPTVTNFVDLHRNYAAFSASDYAAWFALTIEAMERRARSAWPAGATESWKRWAEQLTELIDAELGTDWPHKASVG